MLKTKWWMIIIVEGKQEWKIRGSSQGYDSYHVIVRRQRILVHFWCKVRYLKKDSSFRKTDKKQIIKMPRVTVKEVAGKSVDEIWDSCLQETQVTTSHGGTLIQEQQATWPRCRIICRNWFLCKRQDVSNRWKQHYCDGSWLRIFRQKNTTKGT